MELQFYGANCVRISSKKASIVIDDNLADLGLKSVTKPGEIALYTGSHGQPGATGNLTFAQPGEYEASDVSINGIAARAHIDEEGAKTATLFKLVFEDIRIAVLGHIYPSLSNDQLEQLGMVDVLVIPVGGNGYTLDPVGALKMIKAIEPKLVIPTHYADKGINYPVPQQSLEDALRGLAMEPSETTVKLKLKADTLGETTQLVVVERA